MWRNLVLYDGECGLCDRTVQWLLRHDRKNVLTYAPLQGDTAREFVANVPGEFDTIVFVERGDDGVVRVTDRSRGVFRVLGKLGGFWRVVSWLRFLPRFLTNLGYRVCAWDPSFWLCPV